MVPETVQFHPSAKPDIRDLIFTVVVITDPPLTVVTRDKKYTLQVSIEPLRGGYVDFIPETEQLRLRLGPSRTSLSDDLCFYVLGRLGLWDSTTCDPVIEVAQKIIASHYRQLSEFLGS